MAEMFLILIWNHSTFQRKTILFFSIEFLSLSLCVYFLLQNTFHYSDVSSSIGAWFDCYRGMVFHFTNVIKIVH